MELHEESLLMQLFFDLDGTLIDAKQRVYALFQKLVQQSQLSFNEYWQIKMSQTSHNELLTKSFNYSEEMMASFQKAWHDKIEQPEWLALDKPFDGIMDTLHQLSQHHTLYIVTARQYKEAALKQIEDLNLSQFFKKVLVTEAVQEKFSLITAEIDSTPQDWIIGDTGKDIEVGKKLGMRTAAVLTGFRNQDVLQKYNPDIIIDGVTSLGSIWNK